MPRLQFGEVYHGKESAARMLIQALEPKVGKDAVFPGHGYQVRGNGDYLKVQKWFKKGGVKAEFLDIALNQLESYSAAAQVIEGVIAVLPLWIKHCDSCRKFIFREVMVADNDVDILAAGIFHLVDGLDSAVQRYYQIDAIVGCPVEGFI